VPVNFLSFGNDQGNGIQIFQVPSCVGALGMVINGFSVFRAWLLIPKRRHVVILIYYTMN